MVRKIDLKIPEVLVTRQDLVKIHRELSNFSDAVNQSILRHEKPVKYPAISPELKSVAVTNQIDLGKDHARKVLLQQFQELMDASTTLHISFPSEPSGEVVAKLINWFRQEINPHIFLVIGLQPNIIAGIVLRTANKQFDFSLRNNLSKKEPTLIEALKV